MGAVFTRRSGYFTRANFFRRCLFDMMYRHGGWSSNISDPFAGSARFGGHPGTDTGLGCLIPLLFSDPLAPSARFGSNPGAYTGLGCLIPFLSPLCWRDAAGVRA